MTEQERRPNPLKLTRDYVHEFTGLQGIPGSRCRIRTYEGGETPPVVIATQLPDNASTSVTNLAEYLAAEVLTRYFKERLEEPEPVIWIEHYPAPSRRGRVGKPEYSRVHFSSWSPRIETKFSAGGTIQRIKLGEPEWDDLPQEEVEQLVGQALDEGRPS
jgi:hypothetical protein